MKKFLSYIASGICAFLSLISLLCILIAEVDSERFPWSYCAVLCLFASLFFWILGDSLKWDGTKSDEDNK